MANSFYKKLAKRRDSTLPNILSHRQDLEILTQVLVEYFKNGDNIPKSFFIFKVSSDENYINELLKDIGIEANITKANESLIDGNIYKIEVKNI